MPNPEKDAAAQPEGGALVPQFADPLIGCQLDRVYSADELKTQLEDLAGEPLLEGAE